MQESIQWIEFECVFPMGIRDEEEQASFQALPRVGDTYLSKNKRRYKVQEVIFHNETPTDPKISVVLHDPNSM
jgi:hypothetical protein